MNRDRNNAVELLQHYLGLGMGKLDADNAIEIEQIVDSIIEAAATVAIERLRQEAKR